MSDIIMHSTGRIVPWNVPNSTSQQAIHAVLILAISCVAVSTLLSLGAMILSRLHLQPVLWHKLFIWQSTANIIFIGVSGGALLLAGVLYVIKNGGNVHKKSKP